MKRRIAAFVTVAGLGFVLQIAALWLLTHVAAWPYAAATAAAVEMAVLHNFCWHERWTWRDRTNGSGTATRLAKYHLSTGVSSVAGNVLLTAAWVELFNIDVVTANIAAVASMSVANFLLSDRWVFARGGAIALAAFLMMTGGASAAELKPETLAAWNEYVAAAEAGHHPRQPILPHGSVAGETAAIGESIPVPGGTIHRWRGSTLLRGITLEHLLDGLLHPGTPPPQDDVTASRVISRSGDDELRVYLRLVRKAVVTVTYDTEHDVVFTRHAPDLATSHSIATKISEEGGGDRGFLWRLNSYWRYVQVPEGVIVELESLSLSRGVPAVLRPVAGPIIGRIARESLLRTLEALQYFREPVRTATVADPASR